MELKDFIEKHPFIEAANKGQQRYYSSKDKVLKEI
jgi:hypothetical protein